MRMLLVSAFILLVFAASACSSNAAVAYPPLTADSIAVPPIAYAEGSGWEKVQRECDLQRLVPSYINEFYPQAIPAQAPPASGRVLELEVVHMFAPGGGLYSGPKRLTVAGQLLQDGQVVASFEGRRTTMGGAFATWKGTCALMRRNAKALSRDIAQWLQNPTMDARIGEL